MPRVAAFIDGFNLYYGLKDRHGRKDLWLDLEALITSLLRPDQILAYVTYFTARVMNAPESEARQSRYLDALNAHSRTLTIRPGRFQEIRRTRSACRTSRIAYEEKETDVNIAIALVADAVQDRFDTALLVSGDSDLCPAVREMKRRCPTKRVIAAFPPKRQSRHLERDADGHFFIPINKIRQAQLPAEVITAGGISIKRPTYWA